MFKGNIFVSLDEDHGVIFYTAKGGLQIPKMVHRAIKRSESKWGNSSAVARIVFGEMTAKDPLGIDGFGIVSEVTDNDNWILSINDRLQKIGLMTESLRLVKVFTFEQYLALSETTLEWKTLNRDSHDFCFERSSGSFVPSFNLTQRQVG